MSQTACMGLRKVGIQLIGAPESCFPPKISLHKFGAPSHIVTRHIKLGSSLWGISELGLCLYLAALNSSGMLCSGNALQEYQGGRTDNKR